MTEGVLEDRLQQRAADAARGIVDLTVRLDRQDRVFLHRLDPYRPYRVVTGILARLGAGTLAAGIVGALMLLKPDLFSDAPVPTQLLAGGLVGIVAYRFGIERLWQKRIARQVEQASPSSDFHFRTDGAVLTIDDAQSHFRMALGNVQRVVDTPQRVALVAAGMPVVVLPRAAFGESAVAEAFLNYLRGKVSPAPDARRHEQ